MIARDLERGRGIQAVRADHRQLRRRSFGASPAAARDRGSWLAGPVFRPAVLMFDPHPSCVVAPERAPRLLTSLEERCELIQGQGIENVLIQPFTVELARLTPEEFATQFLRDGLGRAVRDRRRKLPVRVQAGGRYADAQGTGRAAGVRGAAARDRAVARPASFLRRSSQAGGRGRRGDRGTFTGAAVCDFGRNRARDTASARNRRCRR